MFNLVADVEKYPEFLPWCLALRILDRKEQGQSETLLAEMVVAYKVFREKFKSEVTLDRDAKIIHARYIDGPFAQLHTRWQFGDTADGGSIVHFFIEFEFRNLLLQTTARAVFERAFAKMSEAFIARADKLYANAG